MGVLTPLAVRIGRLSWLPRFLPQIVVIDKGLQTITRGRLTLLDLAGLPNLRLTVIGRKSGLPRSSPLLCVPSGPTYVVAGSNFGGPAEPEWVRNLEAAKGGTIRVKGRVHRCIARLVEGEERAAMWRQLLRTWPNFALYEKRTTRRIKVFQLTITD